MQNNFEIMNHQIEHDSNIGAPFRVGGKPVRFDEAWVRQMFLERTQHRIEPFDMANLEDKATARSQFRQFGSMCSVVGDRLLDQHMFALGKESACNLIMSIRGCCHGSGVNHRAEIIKGFGCGRPEFARNCAAPQRLDVVNRGELSRRNFCVEPCMIASDMPNTNNANAQLFHRSPNAVNPESFRGSTLESLRKKLTSAASWPETTRKFGRYRVSTRSLAAILAREFWLRPKACAASRPASFYPRRVHR